MLDFPEHPVRKYPQFVMLRHLERHPDRFGVKLKLSDASQVRVHWVYDTTPLEALNNALVCLVASALSEGPT
jgi:hypothetical protein